MAGHEQHVGASRVLRRVGSALISARARAVMSIGIVLGIGAVGTLAAWSDTSTATSGTFTTGTIDIKVGNPAVDDNPPAFATALTNTAIAPGNTVTAPLLVRNSGSVAFNYTISVVANSTTGLGALLNSAVYAGNSCTATALSTVTGLSSSKFFQQASPAGNLTRPIAVGATDQLCISVIMPSTATAPATPATGTITYSLVATST
nr:SipW-dependent-type signal peptide-containing protein [Rhodococcus sp. (in: high G+C Gram-positive bacteria)]